MSVTPLHKRGYTNPHLLAETDWLNDHLGDAAVRIVDARPPQQYAAGHIRTFRTFVPKGTPKARLSMGRLLRFRRRLLHLSEQVGRCVTRAKFAIAVIRMQLGFKISKGGNS